MVLQAEPSALNASLEFRGDEEMTTSSFTFLPPTPSCFRCTL